MRPSVINARKNVTRHDALKQELEQKLQKITDAQIIAICSLNVLVPLSFYRKRYRQTEV